MDTPPRLDDHVCFALYRASRATTAVYRTLLADLGITYPQYLVLVALWERDDRGVADLCDALDLDTGTVSPLVRRLEHLGLVARRRAHTDERRVTVTLTPAGRDAQRRAADVPARLAAVLATDPDELAHLRTTLHRLARALRENPIPPPGERS